MLSLVYAALRDRRTEEHAFLHYRLESISVSKDNASSIAPQSDADRF